MAKDGLMPNLYHKSHSTGNFNAAMNFRNYNEWLIEKVTLNLFPQSAVVTSPPHLIMAKHIQLPFHECSDIVDKKVILSEEEINKFIF